jgi:tetratricopeptide (TPR) repeat protein
VISPAADRTRIARVLSPALAVAVAIGLLVSSAGADAAESLPQLEARSKAFYDLLERGERERAASMWPDLERALAASADELKDRLDTMREAVIDQDGDLEELYRTPRWREPEIASLVVTYHLAWVRYQGAQLTGDAARKKKLLQQAIEGFSQFLVVNDVPEIYSESLYGRGLAFLDLGETGKAIEDLESAANEPRTAGKAKAALDEARRRASGKRAAPENDPEALMTRLGELLPRAAGGDVAAEKEATTLARGLAVRGGVWPARVRSLVTDKLGDGTGVGKARSSYGLYLLAQLAVDNNHCADVASLADASAKTDDSGRPRHRPEILFLDAGCKLNGGHAREAADAFATLLRDAPDSPHARESAYYRFRALDVARANDPSLAPAFEDALTSYLARWDKADGAGEARFLLAELYRSRGDCARAGAEYAKAGAGAFAARAKLGTLECQVGALGPKSDPADRARLLAALRAFVKETPARGNDETLVARAALMAALVAAGSVPPDNAAVVEMLDGFATRYPAAKEFDAKALELRLRARVALGRTQEAEHDLDAYLAATGTGTDRRRLLSQLGRDLAARADRADGAEKTAALAMARKAYGSLVQDGGQPADRIVLADLSLRAGDAAAARQLYEEVLKTDATSSEALRGAARAAASAGDRDAALGFWRRVLDAAEPGTTGWFEARLAQATLLSESGQKAAACDIVRSSRGRSKSTGADQLESRLTAMAPDVCK